MREQERRRNVAPAYAMKKTHITQAQARRLCVLVGTVAFLAGIAVAISISPRAEPLKIEIAAGQCRYGKSPDGTWWQSDHENHSIYKSNCGEIGLARKFDAAPAFGWSVRYLTLGRAHTRALAQTFPGDDAALKNAAIDYKRAECSRAFNGDNCLYQWSGDGGIGPALNFALNADLVKLGPVTIEGELGGLLYRLTWQEQVYPLNCHDDTCPWRVTVNQKSGYFVSPMAGITARFPLWENLSGFVATRYYLRTSQHTPITAGIAGPVQTWLLGIQASF